VSFNLYTYIKQRVFLTVTSVPILKIAMSQDVIYNTFNTVP